MKTNEIRAKHPGGIVVKNVSVNEETWVRSLGCEDPLEEEMTTHCGILAWKIPWTEESGRLQSMGRKESGTNEHKHWLSEEFLVLNINDGL